MGAWRCTTAAHYGGAAQARPRLESACLVFNFFNLMKRKLALSTSTWFLSFHPYTKGPNCTAELPGVSDPCCNALHTNNGTAGWSRGGSGGAVQAVELVESAPPGSSTLLETAQRRPPPIFKRWFQLGACTPTQRGGRRRDVQLRQPRREHGGGGGR